MEIIKYKDGDIDVVNPISRSEKCQLYIPYGLWKEAQEKDHGFFNSVSPPEHSARLIAQIAELNRANNNDLFGKIEHEEGDNYTHHIVVRLWESTQGVTMQFCIVNEHLNPNNKGSIKPILKWDNVFPELANDWEIPSAYDDRNRSKMERIGEERSHELLSSFNNYTKIERYTKLAEWIDSSDRENIPITGLNLPTNGSEWLIVNPIYFEPTTDPLNEKIFGEAKAVSNIMGSTYTSIASRLADTFLKEPRRSYPFVQNIIYPWTLPPDVGRDYLGMTRTFPVSFVLNFKEGQWPSNIRECIVIK